MAGALKILSLLFVSATVLAQPGAANLNDPTRPPAGFAASSTQGATEVVAGGRLRSVKIVRRGRSSAVIDGQVLRLGDRLGEARLVRLTENEAVLEGPGGRETLYLTPDVMKKPVPARAVRVRKKEMP